jgi:hypothetical protein
VITARMPTAQRLWTPRKRILFDAVGAGANVGTTSSSTLTETHVLGHNASAILAYMGFGLSGTVTTITCKVGTTSMNLLATAATATNFVYLYGLIGPPTGSQTISGALTTSANFFCSINSVSYRNVGGFGVPNTNTGSSATASNTINWGGGAVFVQGMENGLSSGNSFSAYTGTSRSSQAQVFNNGQALLIGDTIGLAGSGTSLSGSNGSSTSWESIAVQLLQVA